MLLISLFMGLRLTAQPAEVPIHPIRFQNLTNVDGLSQVSALAIVQDQKGFIWVGTEDGLNRYDGDEFRVFRHRPGDPALSQLAGAIQALHADRAGNLWIGMRIGGFSRYDPKTERFTHYLQGDEDIDGLSQSGVSVLHEDGSGIFWIGFRGGGLLRLDPASGHMTSYRHDPGDPTSLGHDGVEAIAETSGALSPQGGKTLWIGTNDGLERLNPMSGKFTHYRHRRGDPRNALRDRVKALYAATDAALWIGTDGGGLVRFDPREETFTHIPTGGDPRENFIWALTGDRSDILWIGTFRSGLLRFDPATGHVSDYRHNPDIPGTVSSNDIRSILEDHSGNIWVGTWAKGVDRFHPDTEPFLSYQHIPADPMSLSEGIVMAIHEGRDATLWIGTTEGLNQLDRSRREFIRYSADPEDPHALGDDRILALDDDEDGHLWIATPGILYRLDPARRVFTPFPFDIEAARNPAGTITMDIHADASGLWIGTYRGLDRLDPATGDVVHYRHDPNDPTSLSNDFVTHIAVSRSGDLWIGTLDGLNRFDPASTHCERFLTDPEAADASAKNQVMHIYEDRLGTLWLGTFGGGLIRFEPQEKRFQFYTEKDGLPNNVIYMILEDDSGRLWMSTNRGLARFEPTSERFTSYDPGDGLLDYEFNLGAGVQAADGWMHFGSIGGVNYFRPGRFRENSRPPPVVITSFKIFHEEAALGTAAPYLEEIELSHRENFFSFDFAALNFQRSDKNRYAFMLEGVDQDWVDGGTRNFTSYTNVGPGDYVFRVRAANNDGVWNEEGTRLAISIRAPLWSTWWAYTCYLLVAGALVGGLWHVQRKKIAHEQAVVKRLRQVDGLKDEFLANTSHELRTPLHGMMGLAESLIDGVRGELPAKAQNDLRMIVASGRRLSNLVNDILDFSKLRHMSIELERQPVDLRALTDVVLALSRPLARDKHLELRNKVPADLPPANGDENRLHQVLHNLVGNAVKFTDEGSVEVDAMVDEDELIVRVADTGIGIQPEAVDRIFGAFEQLDSSASRVHGGTGIGLAVSQRLVELHGGAIWMESSFGMGSVFSFSLPVWKDQVDDTSRRLAAVLPSLLDEAGDEPGLDESASRLRPHPDRLGPGEHLLIVDDEPVNRRVLINLLKLENYRLQTAANGPEALALLEEHHFDLVLLDVMMPKMSGYEVCAKIREEHSAQELPIIFLTARSQDINLIDGFAAGANDYLTKPVAKDELLARVKSHLDLLHMHRNLESLVVKRTSDLEERERLIAKLEGLITEVEYINYTVSHDFRNPLVTIKNFIGLVKKSAAEGDTDKLQEGLEHIDSAADQMRWLLDELVRYSRVSREVHEPTAVALAEIVQVVHERLGGALEQRGFAVVVARGLPRVEGDPALLLVVFQSLFDNAVKFVGETAAPRLEVGVRHGDGEEVVYVRDNGMGIEAKFHERIFRLFDRLDMGPPGTGVGLALVRRIMEAHGGRVWVESEGRGKGSTFCLTFGRPAANT